jgi:hypothetical protein
MASQHFQVIAIEPHHRDAIARHELPNLFEEDHQRVLEVGCQADAVDQIQQQRVRVP